MLNFSSHPPSSGYLIEKLDRYMQNSEILQYNAGYSYPLRLHSDISSALMYGQRTTTQVLMYPQHLFFSGQYTTKHR